MDIDIRRENKQGIRGLEEVGVVLLTINAFIWNH